MASVKFYLKGEGLSLLMCSFTFRRMRIRVSTNQFVPSKAWNQKSQLAKTIADFDPQEINHYILTKSNDIRKAYLKELNEGKLPTEESFKPIIESILVNKKLKTGSFVEFFDDFMTRNDKRYQPGTKRTYNVLKSHILEMRPNLRFEDVNKSFYESLVSRVLDAGRTNGTAGNMVKVLKLVMNDAFERGLHDNMEYKKKYFKKLTNDFQYIYLNEDEIKKLIDCVDMPEYLKPHRDTFVLSCYTGLRYSDWHKYSKKNLVDGCLKVTTTKTREPVLIPLKPIALEIFNRVVDSRTISNYRYNQYLKKVGSCAGLGDKAGKITTHTARRSFCTNAYLAGVPILDIMAISGHRTTKSFMQYIRVTKVETAQRLKAHPFFM